jgi:formate/nitrite transporter
VNILLKNIKLKNDASLLSTFYASFWAGIAIAFGAILFALLSSLSGDKVLYKWLGALAFSIGLILIVFFKGQLFTGNNLMIFSVLKRELSFISLAKNWSRVYLGNFVGSIVFVFIIWLLHQFFSFNDELITRLSVIANNKVSQTSVILFFKAIACNVLVCLAVYLSVVSNNLWKKVISIIAPITLFVGLGFEHSVANMFLIPIGFLINGHIDTVGSFGFLYNLTWVTLGNIIGGGIVSLFIFVCDDKVGMS